MPTPARYALRGAVVTMDAGVVLADAVVYIDATAGKISAIRTPGDPPPAGFQAAPVINTNGTIYPGLIELHNHLPYNILNLWRVPKQYDNRDQWPNHADYLKLVRGPIQTLGNVHAKTYLAAMVRYVEAKCMMGGVTTSQGITLSGVNPQKHFRGNVRNVESTGVKALPNADGKIGDVEEGKATDFLKELAKKTCFLLHLSEGRQGDDHALQRFDRLQLPDGATWAITPALTGIHSAALRKQELDILAANGGAMVWSPFSNLVLYGTTADVVTAKQKGIRIALGSDWSPSGTKNLLGEIKVARLFSQNHGNVFSDEELIKMATSEACRILKWENAAGKVKEGMFADLVVIAKTGGNPYARLVEATESDISLLVIHGAARYGRKTHMQTLGINGESWKTGSAQQMFEFEMGAPISIDITLKEAARRLTDGLQKLPTLARTAPPAGGGGGMAGVSAASPGGATGWKLDLHDDSDNAFFASGAGSVPFKDVAVPLELDPLTVVDDPNYLARVKNQNSHVPAWLRDGLAGLY